MRSLQITDWCHAIFQTFVLRDGVYVDATMGKGRDTLFLCRLAVEQGLRLLKPGGVMSLCIYSGGDTGFAEKEALLGYLKKLPSEAYTVILSPYYNRRGDPPLPVFVFRQK